MRTQTKRPGAPITNAIRQIIEGRGLSPYEIAKTAGVSPSTLTRFLAGERSLKLETLDQLADVLGLRVTSTIRRRPGN